MKAKIRFNPVASTDLQEIREYLMEDNPGVAVRIIQNIVVKIEALADFPEMGSSLASRIRQKSKYRYLVCGQYLAFYIYEDGIVYVQRILHCKRNFEALLLDDNDVVT
ncbi:MAG TPA: type II toxin-antitoxin system mRNA interferase toxin, RelE/StbE family [Syntrophomonas sp.]|jgi:plasmid stabilization system protein ParE|nr:type II toxin-antitoxin system mRNA interferase toxin, RelE/StbE family [Syntrophomonas sp.]